MTSKMIISEGQNIVDIALQEYGTLDALVGLCDANGTTLNAVLSAGLELTLPTLDSQRSIINYYKVSKDGYKVNTGEKPLLDLEYRVVDNDEPRLIENEDLRLL